MGKQRPQATRSKPESEAPEPDKGPIPDIMRRAMALGLSSFFTTEEAFRKAIGDSLPQDWVDFASEQSDRTRREFADRMAREFGRVLGRVDLGELLSGLIADQTIEIEAKIRLVPRGAEATGPKVRLRMASDKDG